MNFEDESYVRLYVRDTKTWLRLEFEGQCVLMFLLRKLDKAGVLDGIEDLESDVALVTRVPLAIVEIGMPRLLRLGVFELHGTNLVMPNYIQAQNAIRTDKARQKDSREKRLATARLVTLRDGADTRRDETSREPTAGHAQSHDVTLYSADLHSASLGFSELGSAGSPKPPPVESDAQPASDPAPLVTEIRSVSKLSRFAPKDYQPTEAQRVRCQELRFDVDELLRGFLKQEFRREYSDWELRFDKWIEQERIERETRAAQARAGPKRSGSAQPDHGVDPLANFKGVRA